MYRCAAVWKFSLLDCKNLVGDPGLSVHVGHDAKDPFHLQNFLFVATFTTQSLRQKKGKLASHERVWLREAATSSRKGVVKIHTSVF